MSGGGHLWSTNVKGDDTFLIQADYEFYDLNDPPPVPPRWWQVWKRAGYRREVQAWRARRTYTTVEVWGAGGGGGINYSGGADE